MALNLLEKIRGGPKAEQMDYIEVDEREESTEGKFFIKVETLGEFSDVDRIQEHVRAGDIVWVKIKPLKEKDMTELKRSIDRLRKTCVAINGDIAGIDEDFIVLTPPGVIVHRK